MSFLNPLSIYLDKRVLRLLFLGFSSWLTILLIFSTFTSIMLFFPKLLSGYSDAIVDNIGYQGFFIFTAFIGVPVIILNIILIKIGTKNA